MQSQATKSPAKAANGRRAATIPDPDAFRPWLSEALTSLSLRPASYGPQIGLSKNALGHFLGQPGRDLRLGTAASLVRDLQQRARHAGTTLPPLPVDLGLESRDG